MTVKDVYEKWKHVDELLVSAEPRYSNFHWQMCYDLWQAVKAEATLGGTMTDVELRAFLGLLMCSDPWNGGQAVLAQLADRESRKRGYTDWVEAYHKLEAPCPPSA